MARIKPDFYAELVEIQKQRAKAKARNKITEVLCSGGTMRKALDACHQEGFAIGVAAEAVAMEERGWSPAEDQ